MKLAFAKNTKRNLVAGFLNQGVAFVFPFLNRTLFLWLLGPEFLGLNGLFRSILGVLSLAELGFGTAIVCSMYKPIADDDRDLVCAYLRFYRTIYRVIGTFVLVVGLALLPFLRVFIHGDVPAGVNLTVLYLIHLSNSALSYFLFAYRGPVLAAHHRNDVSLHVHTIAQAIQYVTVFFVLLFTRNYYAYIVTTVLFTVCTNLIVLRESVRLFPQISPRGRLPADLRRRVVSDVKSIFLHKIGGVISLSADNLVVSSYLGLAAVAVYGNYYYVVTSVAGLMGVFYTAVQSGFGNKIHTESKESVFRLFMRMNRMTLAVSALCAAVMLAMYQPFIGIWTKNNPNMMRHMFTPVLMVFHFYVNQSRQTLLMFKGAAGIWKQDRWKPLVAGVLNLSLNCAFIIFLPEEFKLDGVIFSTTAAYILIQLPWESHALFSSFFGKAQARAYWFVQLRFAAFAALLCLVSWRAARFVVLPGIPGFFLAGFLAFAVAFAMSLVVHQRDVFDAIALVRRKS